MTGRIMIDVALGTSGIARGAKDGAQALEKLEDAVGDTARAGGRDLEKIERELKDVQREGRKAGTDLERGFDKASRGVDDFKQESNSTFRETAASISSVEDGLGALQEVAANAFAGFGPVGAGAGLVTALGLGLVTAEMFKQQEAAQLLKDSFSEAYQEAAEGGRKYLDAAQITAAANDLIFNPDRLAEYNKLQADALKLGLDDNTLILARAGDQDALNAVLQATADKQQEIRDNSRENAATTRLSQADEAAGLKDIQGDYEAIGQLHVTNAENAAKAQEIKNSLNAQEREQIQRNRDADAARYQAMADLYSKPIRPVVDFTDIDNQIRRHVPPTLNVNGKVIVNRFGIENFG